MLKKMIVLIGIFIVSSYSQQILTLEKSISIALQRNTNLIKSKNSLTSNQAAVKSAYGDLLPSLSAGAGWNWNKSQVKGREDADSRSYSLSVSSNIVLFDGLANFKNISRSEKNLQAAEYDLEKIKQNIVYETTNYFYFVVKAKKMMEVREENVKYNKKFLERIEEMNRLGSIAIADVYQQQVALGNAELLLIQAQKEYDFRKNEFLNFLALNVLEDFELDEADLNKKEVDSEKFINEYSDLSSLINKAITQRQDYKASKLDVESAADNVSIAYSGYLPSLTGGAGWSTSSPSNTSLLFDNKGYSASLNLNIPIFSNFRTENSVQNAKVQELNSLEDHNALERRIKIEVKQSYLDLITSKKQLEVSKKNVVLSEENRKIVQEKYQLGSGTIIEVLESNKNYLSAQSDKISALFDFLISKDKLQNNIGELNYKIFE